MAWSDILDPVLQPLLNAVGPTWMIVILSVVISALITVIYKYTTNQKLMKQLKEEMKEDQKQMKELKGKPDKLMEIQKKVMEKNMKYMMQSMKATLITFIPIIIVFSWMNGHLAAEPIRPNVEFTVQALMNESVREMMNQGNATLKAGDATTGQQSPNIMIIGEPVQQIKDGVAEWKVKAGSGEYFLEFDYEGQKDTRQVTVTNGLKYLPPSEIKRQGPFSELKVVHDKLVVVNLFGWRMGWLGAYIILSIATSMLFRKLLKVY